jgi:hypothetical protein
MYEHWVMKIDLSKINFTVTNPDHPNVEKLNKTATKQECTGIAMIKIIQSTECLRKMYAEYLGDKTPEGEWLIIIITVYNSCKFFLQL